MSEPSPVDIDPRSVRTWVALDVHKLSIVAAVLPALGGQPELHEIDSSERAIRRLVARLGDRAGLAVCYEAGPCGYVEAARHEFLDSPIPDDGISARS